MGEVYKARDTRLDRIVAIRLRTNGAGSVYQVSLDGGLFATWRRDGKELYWVGQAGG
jgi:hypothetical protein